MVVRTMTKAALPSSETRGTCDLCRLSYETASVLDHCAECGTCWEHCPKGHTRWAHRTVKGSVGHCLTCQRPIGYMKHGITLVHLDGGLYNHVPSLAARGGEVIPCTSDGQSARYLVADDSYDCGAHGIPAVRELTHDEQYPVADCAACVGGEK